jgi:hypothetical protein
VAKVGGEGVAYRFSRGFIKDQGDVIFVQDFNKEGFGYGLVGNRLVGERWNSSSLWKPEDVINGVKGIYIQKSSGQGILATKLLAA